MIKLSHFLQIVVCFATFAASVAAQGIDPIVYVDEYNESEKFEKKSLDRKIKNFAQLLSRLPKTARGIIIYEIDIREYKCWEEIKYTAQLRADYVINQLSKKYKIENVRLTLNSAERKTTGSYILFGVTSKNVADLSSLISLSEVTLRNRIRYIVDCFCPTFEVVGRVMVIDRAKPVVFVINLNNWSFERSPVFNWTVSAGKIVSGQGTEKIQVDIGSDKSGETKATATLVGMGRIYSQMCVTSNSFNTRIVLQ